MIPEARRSQTKRRHRYTKVLDHRKQPIRGLWRRNGSFVARLTKEDDAGRKKLVWAPLEAATEAEAANELKALITERRDNQLRHIGRAPLLADYLRRTYLPLLPGTGKKPDTIVTEMGHYRRWESELGHLRLDKIRASHIVEVLNRLRSKRSPRTCNVALVCLRHVLKAAWRDGFLKALPTEQIAWQKCDQRARHLFTPRDIDQFCQAALAASKNGGQLADFIRFLALSGAREQEALQVRWPDVHFDRRQVTIGADGDTKNREARHVDFNPALAAHLEEMFGRRAPDCHWLFPSPQRGEQDIRAKSFRESLNLARRASGWMCRDCNQIDFAKRRSCSGCHSEELRFTDRVLPCHLQGFGFHDCRHHFISYAVMSGIDYMTIARWVGHKDGGILIGKVYGHLSNEHAQAQATKLKFGLTTPIVPDPR